eukprot:RCo019895
MGHHQTHHHDRGWNVLNRSRHRFEEKMPAGAMARRMIRRAQQDAAKLRKLRYRLQRGIVREGDQWAQGHLTYKRIRAYLPLEYSDRFLAVAQGGVDLVSELNESKIDFEARVRDLVKPYIRYTPFIVLHKPLPPKALKLLEDRRKGRSVLYEQPTDSEDEEYELIEGPRAGGSSSDEEEEEEEDVMDAIEGIEGLEEGVASEEEDGSEADGEPSGKKKGKKGKKARGGRKFARGPAYAHDATNEELLYDDGLEDSHKMAWLDALQGDLEGEDEVNIDELESASDSGEKPVKEKPKARATRAGASASASASAGSSFGASGGAAPFARAPRSALLGAVDID